MNVTMTLFGQMITFAILVWFVMKYLWGPLTQAMEERKQRIAQGLEAAEKGRHEQELAQKRATEKLREAKEQASDMLAKAEQRAAQILEEAKEEGKVEAQRIMAAARAEVQQEVAQAREALREQLGTLVINGAEKVLRKEINAQEHDRLLKQLAAQL